MPDGRILLFEANSGMRVNNDYNKNFPTLRNTPWLLEKDLKNGFQQNSAEIILRVHHLQKGSPSAA